MAKVNNMLFKDSSGTIAKYFYFRRMGNQTIICTKPKSRKKKRPLTPSQERSQHKFSRVAAYAKHVINNPELFEYYSAAAAPGQTAHKAAFADAFVAPVIGRIETSHYMGHTGDMIWAEVTDNFLVKSVTFELLDSLGNIIESGRAIPEPETDDWGYEATIPNHDVESTTLRITAEDMPGNRTRIDIRL